MRFPMLMRNSFRHEEVEPQQPQVVEDIDTTAVLSADPVPMNTSPPLSGQPGQQLLRLLQEVTPQEGVVASLTMQLHQVNIPQIMSCDYCRHAVQLVGFLLPT